jgi:hypothetical protein
MPSLGPGYAFVIRTMSFHTLRGIIWAWRKNLSQDLSR